MLPLVRNHQHVTTGSSQFGGGVVTPKNIRDKRKTFFMPPISMRLRQYGHSVALQGCWMFPLHFAFNNAELEGLKTLNHRRSSQ